MQMSNASNDQKHRLFSYLGQPEGCYYMKVVDMKVGWKPHFGTRLVIETTYPADPGSEIQLVVIDKDGIPFSRCCRMHQQKTNQTQAFVFRDPYRMDQIYAQNVSFRSFSHSLIKRTIDQDILIQEMGMVTIPFSGQRIELICYPICNLRCKSAMPGYRFTEDFINPNSDAFRSQFPTLHCNLTVGGIFESSYTQTVGMKKPEQQLIKIQIVPMPRVSDIRKKAIAWLKKYNLAKEVFTLSSLFAIHLTIYSLGILIFSSYDYAFTL